MFILLNKINFYKKIDLYTIYLKYIKKNTIIIMSLITRYLNFQPNNDILTRLGIDSISQLNIIKYNECFLNYINDSSQVNNIIYENIKNYIYNNYLQLNSIEADINYYVEKINVLVVKKFKNIISDIGIDHIISLCDYFKKKISNSTIETQVKNYYIYWRNEYYKMFYDIILLGEYKVYDVNEKKTLIVLLKDEWDKINFINLIEFTNSLNKINFLFSSESNENLQDNNKIDEYINIIMNKFDNLENIKKLIEYVNNKLDYNLKYQQNNNLSDSDLSVDECEKEYKINTSKYNFRFVIDNIKSNGYLLFEEFNKTLKNKYKKQQTIQTIRTDKRIISYYIYLISQKDSNMTNRKVNEILIKMKNFIEDLEESHYNNIAYKKITVKQESEKYISIDLSNYNRDNSTFTILKYSNLNQINITGFNINSEIEPYFDIYKSYYKSRYPDREIEFDPIQSTMIIKTAFNSKKYYIHLALIQYIVLDKLYNSNDNGLGIKDISLQTNISIKNLQEIINSLLYIKLIKRSTDSTSLLDMKFFINYDFTHENNKISISSLLVQNDELKEEDKREFLNDRNTIVLSNMYDYIKKNRTFTIDTIYNEMCKNKIPFNVDLEQVLDGIKILLEKEDIIEINQNQSQNQIKTFKYCEL